MKKICFNILLFVASAAYSQNKPSNTGVPTPTQTVHSIPSDYNNGAPVNYVRTWTPLRPFVNETDVTDTTRTVGEVNRVTQYIDGLSRPLQIVDWQGSPANNSGHSYDIVAPVIYDNLGLESYKYLPYSYAPTASGVGTANGQIKAVPFTEQSSFYNSIYPIQQPALAGEQVYYGENVFESSPLRRTTAALPEGNSWAGSARGITISYDHNVSGEVLQWDYPTADMGAIPTSSQSYDAGELYRTMTVDENGHRVVEYKDKDGREVLKKNELPTSDNLTPDISVHDGWLCTYYVYDDLGLIRTVIPPKATEQVLQNGNAISSTVFTDLCFYYDYDQRNRMIVKHTPGAGEVWMVYDARDRMVMTQDVNMRANDQWLVTQYDVLDRIIGTAMFNSTDDRTYHQSNAYNSTAYPSLTGATYEQLTQKFYDDYSWIVTGMGVSSSLNNTYTTSADYINPNVAPLYAQPVTATTATKGMCTGTKTKVLGTSSTYLYEVSFYDTRDRVIQTQSTNYAGGTDFATIQYDYSGKVLKTHILHVNPQASTQPIRVLTVMSYDHAGRLLVIKKKINDEALKTIVTNTYDQLGRLMTKQLGVDSVNGNVPLETLDYTYNVRGWLTGINRGLANAQAFPAEASAEGNRWFGMQLSYDYGFDNNQYNGNIAGMAWGTKGSGEHRAYGYDYDAANRLLKADFTQYTSSAWNQDALVNYNVLIGDDGTIDGHGYDANGNILRMQQWGLKNGSSQPIDDLSYHYKNSEVSNQLLTVTDVYNDKNTTLGDFKDNAGGNGDDYSYDGNGNMVVDNNKSFTDVQYNYLNQPTSFTIFGKGAVHYVYDAAGNKLQKIVSDNTGDTAKTITDWYIGSFIYKQITAEGQTPGPTVLQLINHEEGRIRPVTATLYNNNNDYAFDYFVKDHLGNIRVVLTEEQRQHIYPVASLEDAKIATEESYYTIDAGRIVDITLNPISGLPAYANDNGIGDNPVDPTFSATNSSKVYKLNGSGGGQTGLGITLHVMAGDVIDIFGKSYYHQANAGDNNSNDLPVSTIISGLLNTPGGVLASSHTGITDAIVNTASGGDIGTFIGTTDRLPTTSTTPRAYVNYIFFDEQFNYAGVAHALKVGTSGVLQDYTSETVLHGLQAPKNGYVYVYCSNESPVDVFFDNLQVVHTHSPLIEETHYYPFGLTMAGISSRASNSLETKYKFNKGTELQHNEFNDGGGLELYATEFRSYDCQIGRFVQLDALSFMSMEESPYVFASNNPITINDYLGLADDTLNAHTVYDDVIVTSYPKEKKTKVEIEINRFNTSVSNIRVDPNNPWGSYSQALSVASTASQLSPQAYSAVMDGRKSPNDNDMEAGARDRFYTEIILTLIPYEKLLNLGRYGALVVRIFSKGRSLRAFEYASEYGIRSYKELKVLTRGKGLQVHHLIEQRFAKLLGVSAEDMESIVLTKDEHQVFTNAWRDIIGYEGSNSVLITSTATVDQVKAAARAIYKNYPQILKALGL